MVWFLQDYFQKKKLDTIKKEIAETDGNDGHIYRLKKIDEIQEILTAERDKRNELVQNITELILLAWLIIV